jgi:hypothetical protein
MLKESKPIETRRLREFVADAFLFGQVFLPYCAGYNFGCDDYGAGSCWSGRQVARLQPEEMLTKSACAVEAYGQDHNPPRQGREFVSTQFN